MREFTARLEAVGALTPKDDAEMAAAWLEALRNARDAAGG